MSGCACGSGRGFDQCCGPIIAGQPAATAEALMRSRYTAFTIGALDHLDRTHAPEVKGDFDRLEAERMVEEAKWQGLELRRLEGGGADDQTGVVEFVFRYSRRGQAYVQHELASFRREDGRWVYQSGELNPKGPPRQVTKPGRNDPCSCGSGQKFKKCCGG